jgi:hypothetical protein
MSEALKTLATQLAFFAALSTAVKIIATLH